MTLPSSGAISIGDLASEFGGSAPHSLSEYYRGGSLVPSTKQSTVTATNTGSTQSGTNVRGVSFEQNPPAFNSGNNIMFAYIWADNGSTGNFTTTQQINVTGTYRLTCSTFLSQGDPGLTCSHSVAVNGQNRGSVTFSQNGSSPQSPHQVLSFSASAGQTITTSCTWGSRGHAAGQQTLNGDAGQRYITVSSNTGVPSSGVITLEDFYGSSA
mgnify:CR=1 FL=1|tara:strand:- start:64 stop:699 length:636 start_codon:yes stop_codon:yes gene_type:complete